MLADKVKSVSAFEVLSLSTVSHAPETRLYICKQTGDQVHFVLVCPSHSISNVKALETKSLY